MDVGLLPQTKAVPSATGAGFHTRMAEVWQAIVTDQPVAALPAFFPIQAYEQLKALPNDAQDYTHRLLGGFTADVHAAHTLLGAGASSATLVEVIVPKSYIRWIPPGYCYNRLGYWFVPGSRMVYREDGTLRSFGIAALDSWRGKWYIIHLGAESHPGGVGVVDRPSTGVGSFGSPAGC